MDPISKSPDLPTARSPNRVRTAGYLVGIGLLAGAAAAVALRGGDEVRDAFAALRDPSWLLVLLLALAMLANIVITGLFFSLLIARYGRVGVGEMQALIATTTMLNYLPLRPGLFGRIAYHKKVNNIAVRDSTTVVIRGVIISIIAGAIGAAAVFIARAADFNVGAVFGSLAALAVAALLTLPPLAARRWRLVLIAQPAAIPLALRLIDVMIWSARYALVFALIDRPIGFDTALSLAIISTIATMVPFISNGLGLREWAVALAAPLLEVDLLSGVALSADLIHRGFEILIAIIAGSIGLTFIARRVGKSGIRD